MNAIRILTVAVIMAGVGLAHIAMPTPAYAQAVLTVEQQTAIQQSVAEAIAAVNAQIYPNPGDKDAAMAESIAAATVSLIAAYGSAAAPQITSLVLAAASSAGVAPAVVGAGLGLAALQIEPSDPSTAAAIAQAVGASSGASGGFIGTVVTAGRSHLGTFAAGGGNVPTCQNPSCS